VVVRAREKRVDLVRESRYEMKRRVRERVVGASDEEDISVQ
jgi:hypothetical protein